MASIVRSSKYRHVFGTASKREACFENLHLSISAFDTNYVTANPKYLAVNWNSGGGGAFCVVPHDQAGKLRGDFPLFAGHAGTVLDTAFSPFDDDVIASGAEDHQAMVWRVPDDLPEREEDVTQPMVTLGGHGRKVGHVAWNPVAADVLAVASSDATVRLWDVQQQRIAVTLQGFKDAILSIGWSQDGRSMAVAARDKKLRIFDARSGQCVQEGASHQGIKGSRVAWLTGPRLVTTGFTRSSDRQVFLWDANDLTKPLATHNVDMSAGMLMPFYDEGTKMLYVAGKGDANIRYYEFADDKLHDLSVYSSAEPQRGLGVMPKRGVDVAHCEVMRFFKVASNSLVEPISFKVPRKSEAFQSDIYPPAPAGVPALSASEFFAGKDAEPLLVDMERLFREGPLVVGAAVKEKPEVMAEQKAKPETKTEAVSEPAPAPAPKHEPKPEITPEPEPVKAPSSVPVQPPVTDSIPPSDAQLSALREENGRLQQQLMQATHDVAEAQAAAQSATAQLASSKQSLAQLQDELTKTQQNVDSLRTELSDASSMIESARAEAAKADAQVQDAATQVAEYRNKLAQAEDCVRGLEQDREKIQGELAQAEDCVRGLEQDREKIQGELAQAEDCVRGLEQDREKIQGELAQAIQAASSLALAAEKAADAL